MNGWVFFAIFIGIAVVSAISHMLKNQQQAEPPPRRRQQRKSEGVRVSSDADQDRFLAEIERLRKKASTGPKPVPTVKPKSPPKKPRPAFTPKLQELPVAAVVPPKSPPKASSLSTPISTPGSTVAAIATIATIADIHKPVAAGSATAAKMASMSQTMSGPASTPFSRDLLAMLKSKGALPMAVVLQEILGTPKCKQK